MTNRDMGIFIPLFIIWAISLPFRKEKEKWWSVDTANKGFVVNPLEKGEDYYDIF